MTCSTSFLRLHSKQLPHFGIRKILRTNGSTSFISTWHRNVCVWHMVHLEDRQILKDCKINYRSTLYSAKTNLTDRCISTSHILMEKSEVKLSRKEQLKKAVKDYGSTVVVFHITISLASLGFFYILVSSGIDMGQIMNSIGINLKFAQNAGTFVTAYAIHKLFAPVRLSITLGATPFIVRYLRNKGILKKSPT